MRKASTGFVCAPWSTLPNTVRWIAEIGKSESDPLLTKSKRVIGFENFQHITLKPTVSPSIGGWSKVFQRRSLLVWTKLYAGRRRRKFAQRRYKS